MRERVVDHSGTFSVSASDDHPRIAHGACLAMLATTCRVLFLLLLSVSCFST